MITFLAILALAPIRIACIGDSITEGRGGMNSYPAQLQKILGSKYLVGNFGRTSASVLPGPLQYSKLPECQDAIDFRPDKVLIMLGTNDSPGLNWSERRDHFRSAYRALITGFRGLKSNPDIVVMIPPPMFFDESDWRPRNLVDEVIPIELALASVEGCLVFNSYDQFKGKVESFPDRLHPNNLGFQVLARAVAKEIFQVNDAALKRLDWAKDAGKSVVVDREEGQYLGHISTTLLSDGKTILAAYPKGHGKGAILLKRSDDGGKSWSERLPVPDNWSTSLETPTIHRIGEKTLVLWSGLYPARIARSEDDGKSWTPLTRVGDWGGIVVMGFTERCRDGRLIAQFHDDGRFYANAGKATGTFTLYQTESTDDGRTWNLPRALFSSSEVHLCEPGMIRSDDGRQMAVLLRENRRVMASHVMFSNDEGKTWTTPRPLNPNLTGDRHTLRRLKDGRIVCVFRDMQEGEWKGDFVAWVGTYADLITGGAGQYKIRLLDNQDSWDCGYPGLELLPDETLVATTYGHWDKGKEPYIRSVRITKKDMPR